MIVTVRILDHIGSYTAGQVTHFDDELDRVFLRALFNGGKAELISPVDWVPPLSWTPLDVPVSGDTSPYLDILEHHAINHTGIPGVPQSGAYVAGTDWLRCGTDFGTTQTLTPGAGYADTTLSLELYGSQGNSFALGTKSVHVLEGTRVRGLLYVDITSALVATAQLEIVLEEHTADVGGEFIDNVVFPPIVMLATTAPYLEVPFFYNMVTEGNWLYALARARVASIPLDDFGGMFIERLA